MLALENLTPGGSEFVDDVARCVAFIRQRQASQHQVILSLGKQLRAIRCFIADEREKVRERCADSVNQRARELRDLLGTIEECCGPGDVDAETERLRMENRAEELELVAAGIRQLDLTKDLAASSEEEGKG
jgi:hypothetical protein